MISMISRHAITPALIAPLLAASAIAQTPAPQTPAAETPATVETPDPLCDGLERALEAADEVIPFIILVPADQSLGSLPRLNRNPLGFQDFKHCQLYRAGNATQGTVGGGPFNYLRCNAFSGSTAESRPEEAKLVVQQSKETYDALATRTKACFDMIGWTASGGERVRHYQDYETALSFTREGTVNEAVVRLVEDNPNPGSRSKTTYWTVDLTVRNPNPNHPKPQ